MGATESRSDAPLKKKSVEPKIESTISDDRTRGSAFDRNRDILSALADTENDVSSFEPTEDQLNDLSGSDNDSILLPVKTEALRSPLVHAREDYQMQLMLLEKQNEKRIRMAQRNLGDRAIQEEPDPVLWSHSRRQETAIRHQKPKTEGEQLSPVADGLEKAVPSEKPDAVVDGNDTIDTASSSSHATAQTALLKQLGIPKQYAGNLQMTQVYISSLRKHSNLPPEPKKPRELILHRVSGSDTYLDKPRWRDGANASSGFLGGKVPISDVRTYLLRHPEVAFIVCRDYKEDLTDFDTENVDENGNVNVYHCSESIIPAERNLALAIRRLNAFANQGFPSKSEAQNMENRDIQDFSNDWLYKTNDFTLSSPYLPFFHSRENGLEDIFECMGPLERVYFRRVVGYIVSNYNKEYEEVESLIRSGRIINAYLPYLFRPGIVVVEGKDENARGYVCESWLKKNDILGMPEEEYSYSIRAWHWDIGCRFTRNRSRLVLSDAAPWDKSEKDIYELELRPLSCVCHKTLERLQTRGQWIWKCLRRQIVGYRGKSTETFHRASGERYMVDMSTYSELHPYGAISEGKSLKTHVEPKDSELFAQEPPPDGSFVYATAAFMRGFNLKTKKWCDLCVDRFEEVEWNTNAFRSLVLNEKTKRLIQALVSNQIEAEMSTDIISGKGNGLIMLLHGGPGTGKTLTAESVAEIAQKPLYPVTCGDMGTDPKEVEKYLESVLHLGKTWGCVVLLDEADVFLEQRSLEDLKRNALVSVFLRVLEYYDGILILTSNRVGTFDEAFKSRIQLAIHYESLTEYQRTKVWGNFISRLKKLNEEGIDFADLEDNIENLARHKMNGREIRNVITTSRQYARWERKQRSTNHNYVLNYRVVEEVIETSGQFDKYIAKLNWGKTHDQLAEEDGLRLANGR